MPRSATFAPLAHRAFVLILAGSLLSNFGNAIESVGAAWQLTADGQPADVIALVQTALNLPIMLLALPAGAWADMHDRRGIMLLAQSGMFAVSVLLVVLTFGGIALGSWLWGHFAEGHGVEMALLASGGAMVVLPLLGLLLPMPAHEGAEEG